MLAQKIPLDVLNRKKRFKAADVQLRKTRLRFDEMIIATKSYPEVANQLAFKSDVLKLRDKYV